MAARTTERGDAVEEILKREPSILLSPEDSISNRGAPVFLFSSLVTHCSKLPVDALLSEEHFDAEQIWSQIELVSRSIHSSLRRKVKQLEHVAPLVIEADVKEKGGEEEKEEVGGGGDVEDENDDEDREEVKTDDDDDDEDDDDDDDDEEEEEEEEGDEKKNTWKRNGVEDRFLKINELEEYLEDDEAREYGVQRNEEKTKWNAATNKSMGMDEDDDEGDKDYGELDLDIDDDDDANDERYEDFFGGETKKFGKRKGSIKEKKALDGTEDPLSNEEENNGIYTDTQGGGDLSTHEKELLKMQSKIHEMEKANLDPKMWTMQGEVTAAKRPKNSALEVDLDFEHNARPPPVITEEVTASIEDLIKKRIVEGHFDDVQRAPDLPLRAPKEFAEMDETKSKKGLAEIYEEEYAQKTGLSTAPLSSSDEKKKEASLLFKRLCLKLDALAHFHFAPKPVIEEMSIHANIPALAMEEIAPVAVSDAAMLAPEEVFLGKGDLKEQTELTQSDRKRKRANKKRRFKVDQTERDAKKVRQKLEHDLQNVEQTERDAKQVRQKPSHNLRNG